MKRIFLTAGMIAATLSFGLHARHAAAETALETRQAALSETIKPGDRVGRLRFLGMLQLPDVTRNGQRLTQLSGLAWDDDDGVLYAVSDKGGLFHLKPEFDGDFLTGLSLLRAVALQEQGNSRPLKRTRPDAEDLDILNGRNRRKGDAELVVSFERVPRIARYRPDGRVISDFNVPAPLNEVKNYRSSNRMLESVCVDPALGVITAPEVPLKNDPEEHNRLFAFSGNSTALKSTRDGGAGLRQWRYPVQSQDRITSLDCLGRGEVIVLQQTYLHSFGQISVSLKRVRLADAPPSEPLAAETLVTLESVKGFLLDNFEGLARHQNRRFFMISDNNDLFVQRTLLMYFELLDD